MTPQVLVHADGGEVVLDPAGGFPLAVPPADARALAGEIVAAADAADVRECCLCHLPLLPAEQHDLTGLAHAGCSKLELDHWRADGYFAPADAELAARVVVAEALAPGERDPLPSDFPAERWPEGEPLTADELTF